MLNNLTLLMTSYQYGNGSIVVNTRIDNHEVLGYTSYLTKYENKPTNTTKLINNLSVRLR
jgi:hypothetical protein